MGVLLNGTTDSYTASTSVGTSDCTILCWGRIGTDRNTFSTFLSISNGLDSSSGGKGMNMQTQVDGTTSQLWAYTSNVDTVAGIAMTVGTWYRMAAVRSNTGTTATYYIASHLGAITSGTATFNTSPPHSYSEVRIGRSIDGERVAGETANVKIYGAALTQAEVEAEWSQFAPIRTANLLHWYPLLAAGTADYSGNGATLTALGTPTTDAEAPPIPWAQTRARLTVPAAVPPPPPDPLRVPVQTIQVP